MTACATVAGNEHGEAPRHLEYCFEKKEGEVGGSITVRGASTDVHYSRGQQRAGTVQSEVRYREAFSDKKDMKETI